MSSEPISIAPASVQLLTVRQVGAILAIHPRSVWRKSATQELPQPLVLGPKTLRWRLSDIEKYIEKLAAQAAVEGNP